MAVPVLVILFVLLGLPFQCCLHTAEVTIISVLDIAPSFEFLLAVYMNLIVSTLIAFSVHTDPPGR